MKITLVSARLLLIACMLISADGWCRGGGGCFEQGTMIETAHGPRPIEQLQHGDRVWSEVNGQHQLAEVVTISKVQPEQYVELTLSGKKIHVTDEHLFAVGKGEYRRAASLHAGDQVVIWNGKQWQPSPILTAASYQSSRPAYNLLVNAGSTFIANQVLVHNKGCFLPNTPILRADGTSIAISQIQPGEMVEAYEGDGKLVSAKVNAVIKHTADSYYIVTTDKAVLNVTGEHPFFVGNGSFKTVKALHTGDVVYAFDGDKLTTQHIVRMDQVHTAVTVYNLQTDEPHTYFAAGIAVHNKGGGCFPAGTKITTPTGTQSIELLAPGDKIISVNRNGREFISEVISTYATRSQIITIKTSQGSIRTTAEHPLALNNGGFITAGKASTQDALMFEKDNQFVKADILSITYEGEEIVYNLQVKSPHTFIANGFVVHNKGGGYGGSGGRGGSNADGFTLFIVIAGYIIYVLLFGGAKKSANSEEDLDFVYSNYQISPKADKTMKLLNFIAKQDETMAPAKLMALTRSVFLQLQDCWGKRKFTPMQPLLMPDLYDQQNRQIQGLIRNHEINVLGNMTINAIYLVNVRYTEKIEQREFTALITATTTDYYVNDESKRFIRGDKSPAQFQEFWTFQLQTSGWLLRDIEQSRESDYLKEENFFEQYTDSQISKIYGDNVDNLGSAGPWLPKEVAAKETKVERMCNFLCQSDKMWYKQGMINRARSIFTNVHLALEAGELNPDVKEQLFPTIIDQFNENISLWKANGNTIEYRNFCVRKIEIVLVKSFDDKSKNEFTARISAHAQRVQTQNGKIITQDADVTPFVEYWTFGRIEDAWKLKEAASEAAANGVINKENTEEGSGANLVKWYYTKKRGM